MSAEASVGRMQDLRAELPLRLSLCYVCLFFVLFVLFIYNHEILNVFLK